MQSTVHVNGHLQFEITSPEEGGTTSHVVISPDGRQLLFTGVGPDGELRLWVRNLESAEARPLPGTEGPGTPSPNPFWSPDSRFVAFSVGGKLRKVPVSGGPSQPICDTADGDTGGGTWNRDGVILFGSVSHGIYSVSASGGTATPVTQLDPSRQERFHKRPVFLPDGRHFLYVRSSAIPDNGGIYLGSLDAKPAEQSGKRLLPGTINVAWAPTSGREGYILFLQEGTLLARLFDLRKGEFSGEPIPVAENVGSNNQTTGYFSVSNNGTLVYRNSDLVSSRLTWLDRQGKPLNIPGEPGLYTALALSPDGNRVAVSRITGRDSSIWLLDSDRGAETRLTFDPGSEGSPVWSPDGTRIAFRRGSDIYLKSSAGAESEELLLKGLTMFPVDWSRNGTLLLSRVDAVASLYFLRVGGDRKPVAYLATPFSEYAPKFSPDGKWVAYRSSEAGRSEIYVRPFPDAGAGKWMISNGGGFAPRWLADGREIIYLSQDRVLMSVEVNIAGPKFQSSPPKPLFAVNVANPNAATGVIGRSWDVTPDGRRFLILQASERKGPEPMTVVLNWQAGLKK